MSAIQITKDNFQKEVIESTKPVLIDFWAAWCGPCRVLSPVVEEIASEVSDVKVGKINVDEEPELASRFRIMSIPTLLLFKDGQLAETSIGLRPKSAILEMLNQ